MGQCPFFDVASKIFSDVVSYPHKSLAELTSASVRRLSEEIFPDKCPIFCDSTQFPRRSRSTQSLVDICKQLGATHYLTGHGAIRYIDSRLFSNEGIELEYINYNINPYMQYEGAHVTSYVSALDAIARVGPKQTSLMLNSSIIPALDFKV